MPEFRVDGVSTAGKALQAFVEADNLRAARGKAKVMATQRKFKLLLFIKRSSVARVNCFKIFCH